MYDKIFAFKKITLHKQAALRKSEKHKVKLRLQSVTDIKKKTTKLNI